MPDPDNFEKDAVRGGVDSRWSRNYEAGFEPLKITFENPE
jgi:hypothetical protein